MAVHSSSSATSGASSTDASRSTVLPENYGKTREPLPQTGKATREESRAAGACALRYRETHFRKTRKNGSKEAAKARCAPPLSLRHHAREGRVAARARGGWRRGHRS